MVDKEAPRRNEGYQDLRDLLKKFEEMGEVAHVEGADWNLEVGAIAEMTAAAKPGRAKAVLFDIVNVFQQSSGKGPPPIAIQLPHVTTFRPQQTPAQ